MISVVVPVRNGMPWLAEQLGALADQQCPMPFEVVVADNGSSDASRSVVSEWAQRCPVIRGIDASSRRGAAATRNAGVSAAQGDLLAFCDADDVVRPGWVAACATALEHADVAAGVFDFWSLNRPGSSHVATTPIPAGTRQWGFLPAGLAANLAVRRSAFDGVGGFAEDLAANEDIDLCWRLQLNGCRFVIAPGALVAKRERPDVRQAFRQGSTYGRNSPILFARYRSAGARRNLAGAVKSWAWLIVSLPGLVQRGRRAHWARTAGMRVGRLQGSVRERIFFP